MRTVLLTCLLLTAFSACRSSGTERDERDDRQLEPHEYVEMVMASPVIIRVYASSEGVARRAVRAAYDRMHALELVLSDWMPESESNRLEAAAPEAIEISNDLRHAITASTELHQDTDGAFDPTVGPLVELWRETRNTGTMPGNDEIRAARNRVDLNSLELRGSTARIAREDVEIDFGAIGKGIALDAASEILDAHGLDSHLINFDGEILVGEAPPERTSWQITILPTGDEDTLVIDAVHASVATSGGLNQFFELDGTRYSHIIDPSTGIGTNCARQVTVISDSATRADALATAGCILATTRFEEILATRFQGASAVVMENHAGGTGITMIGDPRVRALDAP